MLRLKKKKKKKKKNQGNENCVWHAQIIFIILDFYTFQGIFPMIVNII